MIVDGTKTDGSATALRRSALRGVTLGVRSMRHPTWAAANVQNLVERRLDRRYAHLPAPRGGQSMTEVLCLMTGAEAPAVAAVLADVPKPTLRQNSSLYGTPNGSRELVALAYAYCRLRKPDTVLETGVANGFTTAAILQALAENDHGVLLSIDLPHLHPQAIESVGSAVDPALRGRWQLHFGPAARRIPDVAAGGVDVFVQDAAHTYLGQRAEYRAGWPLLKEGGVMISDDVGPCFAAFAREVGLRPLYVSQEPKAEPIGVLVKGAAT
ncbi:MAG: class I SAM-dependent methyltransferase [Sporichthyaceae bacterium]